MIDAPVAIDQMGYHNLVDGAILYLEELSNQLVKAYSELESQSVDIDDLGAAAEALIYSVDKLKEQKLKLVSYRDELQRSVMSQYDQKGDK